MRERQRPGARKNGGRSIGARSLSDTHTHRTDTHTPHSYVLNATASLGPPRSQPSSSASQRKKSRLFCSVMSALLPLPRRCHSHQQQLLRRWIATQSRIMSGRLLQQQQQQPLGDDDDERRRRRVTTSAAAADGADADGAPPPSPPPPPARPSHHLPPEPPSVRSALASAAARLLARCGVATATAGMSPRFTNPWPTWTGDKSLAEVVPFLRAMRARAPDGALEGAAFPTAADYARAFPLHVPDLEGFPPARDQQQQSKQQQQAQSDQPQAGQQQQRTGQQQQQQQQQ